MDTGRDVAVLLEDVDLRVHDWRRRRHLARAHFQAVAEARARRDRRRAGFAFGFRLGVDSADGVGTEELPTDGDGEDESVAGEGSAWLGDCVSEDWAGARWWFGAALQGQGPPPLSTSPVNDTTALVVSAGNTSVATGTPASTAHDDDTDVAAMDGTTEHANASSSDGAAQGEGLEEEAAVLRALQRGVAVLQARQADACLRTGEGSPSLRVHVYVSET